MAPYLGKQIFAYISQAIMSPNEKRRKYEGPGSQPSCLPQHRKARPPLLPYSPLEAVKSMATVKLICVLKRRRPGVTWGGWAVGSAGQGSKKY